MKTFDDEARRSIVAHANLAPSAHNTQPTRWRFETDGSITLLADRSRFLPAADPEGRDAALSCGAALEGTVIALAEQGLKAEVEPLWDAGGAGALIPVARLDVRDGGEPSSLSQSVQARSTWRGGFAPANPKMKADLAHWAVERADVVLATERSDLEMLAGLNDAASLDFYSRTDYRHELVDWMRLTRAHPHYDSDGLNREALHLGTLTGHAAQLALGNDAVFALLQRMRIAGTMLSERDKTLSSTAIVLFHRPIEEAPVKTGRVLYRLWLELAAMGYGAWPMTVVADHPEAAKASVSHFGIAGERRLVTLLRIGVASGRAPRTRLPAASLLID